MADTLPDRIIIDPGICHGQPIVRGTRTPVTVVLGAVGAGDSFDQIQQDYDIAEEDIRACVAFASNELASQSYHLLKA